MHFNDLTLKDDVGIRSFPVPRAGTCPPETGPEAEAGKCQNGHHDQSWPRRAIPQSAAAHPDSDNRVAEFLGG